MLNIKHKFYFQKSSVAIFFATAFFILSNTFIVEAQKFDVKKLPVDFSFFSSEVRHSCYTGNVCKRIPMPYIMKKDSSYIVEFILHLVDIEKEKEKITHIDSFVFFNITPFKKWDSTKASIIDSNPPTKNRYSNWYHVTLQYTYKKIDYNFQAGCIIKGADYWNYVITCGNSTKEFVGFIAYSPDRIINMQLINRSKIIGNFGGK